MVTLEQQLSFEVLRIDPERAVARIADFIKKVVAQTLRKRGAVVGVSGGIDSAVVTALCARSLGPNRVMGVFTPERDSGPDTLRLSRMVAESQGVSTELEDITPALEAVGCYARRDRAIRRVIPEYGRGWTCKIVLPSVTDDDRYRIFSLVALDPTGTERRIRLTPAAYLDIVASTNFKQRTRKMIEAYYADRLSYAIAGTPNRLEYDQGFFVKGGDGQADFKPIAHLYKSQVYQLAGFLRIPEEVRSRPPTTDTYSMPQGQDEFYFSLPYAEMDLCLYAMNHGFPASALTETLGLSEEKIQRVFRDIEGKRNTTRYQHLPPQLVEEVAEIGERRAGQGLR